MSILRTSYRMQMTLPLTGTENVCVSIFVWGFVKAYITIMNMFYSSITTQFGKTAFSVSQLSP